MLSVTVRISGDKEVIGKLQKLGQSFSLFRSAMDTIGKDVSDYFSTVGFASQGAVFGAPWPALNRRYAVRKFSRWPGRGPLIASGSMQHSFTHSTTNTSVTIENSADYFKYHQSSAPRTKMPYRPMMGINKTVRTMVHDIVEKDIKDKLKKAGL